MKSHGYDLEYSLNTPYFGVLNANALSAQISIFTENLFSELFVYHFKHGLNIKFHLQCLCMPSSPADCQ